METKVILGCGRLRGVAGEEGHKISLESKKKEGGQCGTHLNGFSGNRRRGRLSVGEGQVVGRSVSCRLQSFLGGDIVTPLNKEQYTRSGGLGGPIRDGPREKPYRGQPWKEGTCNWGTTWGEIKAPLKPFPYMPKVSDMSNRDWWIKKSSQKELKLLGN